jgi:hypothetical protein
MWKGKKNEVRNAADERLLLRDSVMLGDGERKDGKQGPEFLKMKTDGMGMVVILGLYGHLSKALWEYFMSDFEKTPAWFSIISSSIRSIDNRYRILSIIDRFYR